ncbi:helix-turn-helix domain-containing protein [Rhodococcus sp. USK13]|uniref:helix-turn-helix domain-containing protein n=1 Tax=Rhodococcus sp. USK13 TaxID=2806442 RepID=UPI002016943B|nr:helix-turn-helix domain-containing protein [Rhodococcus sp. USK13]
MGLVRAGSTAQRTVLRALIVLMAADGDSNAHIAAELGVCVDTARKWRARFSHREIGGLTDAPRSGRPTRYSPSQVAAVKAWACQLPTEHELPLSRWSAPELARQLLIDGISASVTTVRRWLAQDALKPWQYQSWIFIRDRSSRRRPPSSSISMPAGTTESSRGRTST